VREARGIAELGGMQIVPVTESGRFMTSELVPGRYQLILAPPVPGWRLVSAMFGDRDAFDFDLDIAPGSAIPAGVITLTTATTEVSGTLFDAQNTPSRDYTVVVFPVDDRYWLPGSRRTRVVRPDAAGHFVFKNLPAGAYRLAAADDLDPNAGIEPSLLRQLAATSTATFTIAEGEKKTQDVRIRWQTRRARRREARRRAWDQCSLRAQCLRALCAFTAQRVLDVYPSTLSLVRTPTRCGRSWLLRTACR
jgi:hypothetical protein